MHVGTLGFSRVNVRVAATGQHFGLSPPNILLAVAYFRCRLSAKTQRSTFVRLLSLSNVRYVSPVGSEDSSFFVYLSQLFPTCFLPADTLLLDFPALQQVLALFIGCCSKSLINKAPGS